jgi:ABC-type transport system substrate-binding protein
LLATFVAWGCGSGEPKAGNELIFASSADATILDPHDTTDSQSDQIIHMIYDGLIRFDENMNIVGDLAADWNMAEDGRTWTFHLRQGVRFHDGSPFRAESVQRNFARVLDAEQNYKRRPLFEVIEKVEVVDDLTVRIVTRYPFGAFEPTMAHISAYIVNPDVAEAHGKKFGTAPETTSGTGPYRLVRWRKDLEVVLERNDDYWGEKGKLERVIYRPIPEAASRVIALESGDVDVITHIPPADVARLDDEEDIVILKEMSIGSQQFRFHCRKAPFEDPRVRQAISYAVDRRVILENLLPGLAAASTGPLTPKIRGRADLGEIPHDPEKAKALLAVAGYPNGFEVTIHTTPRYLMGVEIAEALAAQLGQIGIESEIIVMEWGTIRQLWGGLTAEECPFDIFIMGAGASSADADWGLRPIFMTQPTNENNYGFYSNAEFDDVIIRAMREIDPDKRNALYRRAQEIVYLEDPGAIWLYDIYHVVAARKEVEDITTSALGVVTFESAHLIKDVN